MLSGTSALLSAITSVDQDRGEAVLATVVKVAGSAYRRPGARMLIPLYGGTVGTISGGCLESEVAQKAWWLTDGGEAVIRRYSTATQDDDDDQDAALTFGLGCNGTVYVLLERHSAQRPLAVLDLLRLVRESGQGGAMATVIASHRNAQAKVGDHLMLHPQRHDNSPRLEPALDQQIRADLATTLTQGRSTLRSYHDGQGEVEVFCEYLAPQRRLVIFGAGHDAQPLVHMAKLMDWHVTVIDGRAHFARPERFAEADAVLTVSTHQPYSLQHLTDGAVVAVMTHSYSQDRHWLGAVLQGEPLYVGQLGPRERTERLLGEIGAQACDMPALDRLHYPIGLDIGGDTPESVATAILAEITATLNQRNGGMLKHRRASIHAPTQQDALDIETTLRLTAS
ncbi:Xanthine dehydrogenase accessory factor [Pseudomonas sp. 8Z]|uniref:XdhC family protein n=1 Tax=Pseudomonas sp. 8Z TaxID=2653166 RepID=UPI0012F04C4D|nr:XdhC/CoxI family protein [Pseudomonas sp. 8Z]VXC87328.1 Xanthine dehydrogenase accessory factor [Pseudomonas sp. 8Z]